MSVIPIIKKFEKNKKIKSIIVTTTTTSSAKIFTKLKFKKTFHVYFPLDNNFLTKRFIKYAQSRNLKIMVWTINDEKTLKKLINLNVDGIITDKPKFLHQLLKD